MNNAVKGKGAASDIKDCRSNLKEPTTLQSDSSKAAMPVELSTCNRCQVSVRGLVQCECCNLWHCNVCCGITEDPLVLLGEAECLHFFLLIL